MDGTSRFQFSLRELLALVTAIALAISFVRLREYGFFSFAIFTALGGLAGAIVKRPLSGAASAATAYIVWILWLWLTVPEY
jgi:hypothetical protein